MKQKIYILHGWADSTEKWEPFVKELEKAGFDPVLLKIPGLTTSLKEVWDVNDYVEWLKKIVDREQGKVILLGHSNGGRINLAFTLKYAEKVTHLILINSAGIYHNELPIKIKRLIFGIIAKLGSRIKEIKPIRRIFYKLIMERDYEKAGPVLRKTMINLINHVLSRELNRINVPTTIVWGKNDSITPLRDGRLMHEKIKNSTLHIIETARHSPQFTNAKEVVDIILKEI